jgi:hypothetical protein
MLHGRRRTQRPHGTEAGKPSSKRSLNTFTDIQPERYGFVGIKFDCPRSRATEHLAVELAPYAVKKRSMDATRAVSPDISNETQHAPNSGTTQFQFGMKPNNTARMFVGKTQFAPAKIINDYSASRIAGLLPEAQRKFDAPVLIIKAVRAASCTLTSESPTGSVR